MMRRVFGSVKPSKRSEIAALFPLDFGTGSAREAAAGFNPDARSTITLARLPRKAGAGVVVLSHIFHIAAWWK
jgi:hypothetical protein